MTPTPAGTSASDILRGTWRLFAAMGWACLPEFVLPTGRRADLAAIDARGRFAVVEIKSSLADFRADGKWRTYLAHADLFFFAVAPDFPLDVLPEGVGLVVADRYDAVIVRQASEQPLPSARRRALLLRFARAGGNRLYALSTASVAAPPSPS